jgi:hypothetical protein
MKHWSIPTRLCGAPSQKTYHLHVQCYLFLNCSAPVKVTKQKTWNNMPLCTYSLQDSKIGKNVWHINRPMLKAKINYNETHLHIKSFQHSEWWLHVIQQVKILICTEISKKLISDTNNLLCVWWVTCVIWID